MPTEVWAPGGGYWVAYRGLGSGWRLLGCLQRSGLRVEAIGLPTEVWAPGGCWMPTPCSHNQPAQARHHGSRCAPVGRDPVGTRSCRNSSPRVAVERCTSSVSTREKNDQVRHPGVGTNHPLVAPRACPSCRAHAAAGERTGAPALHSTSWAKCCRSSCWQHAARDVARNHALLFAQRLAGVIDARMYQPKQPNKV